MAIKEKAGQTEWTNEDLYKDFVEQTMALQEQNVKLALSVTDAYMSFFFAPLSCLREGLQPMGTEGGGSEKDCDDLPLDNYDHLTAENVSEKIEELGALEVQAVRSYERRHKNRGELLERLDRSLV